MSNNKDTKIKTPKKKRTNPYSHSLKTHTGHKLTDREAIFIDKYIELGNQRQAVIESGYTTKAPGQYAQTLFTKSYIKEEIMYRLEQAKTQRLADTQEIMEYFTSVMRGETKDQFGLDAPLSERTKAATELAKRVIDIPNKLQGKEQPEVKVVLNWKRSNDN